MRTAGAAVAAGIWLLCLGPIALLFLRAGEAPVGAADWAAVRFTVWQAAASAAVSVAFAIPLARALARRDFPGRRVLVAALGAPFLMPTIVAVLGVLAVWGRSGWLADLGAPLPRIYGAWGVVLAHVVLNLPLATRLLLQGWQAIPAERFRLAAQLGAPVGRLLEWPMLRERVPGALAAIFALCLTSFAVALTLGGGPRATTVELAVYQAVRFEGDLGLGARLALMQTVLCALAAWLAAVTARGAGFGAGIGRPVRRWDAGGAGAGARAVDAAVIVGFSVFALAPLAAAVWRGAGALDALPEGLGAAALRSLCVALGAAAVAVGGALALAARGGRIAEMTAALPLAASALVLGTGVVLAVRAVVSPSAVALPVAALVDGLLAVPFAFRTLAPALAEVEARHGRLAAMLGLSGWARWRIVRLPLLSPALGFAAGLSAALSVGSLGVVALLAAPDQATLPVLMMRLMGAYRMDAAAATGLVTMALAFGLYGAFDRGGRA